MGVRSNLLLKQLQMDADLTLENVKKAIQQKESVHEQHSVLNDDTTASPMDAVKSGSSQGQSQPTAKQIRSPQCHSQPHQSKKHCTRCGKSPHSRDKCSARELLCCKCHCKGHYSNQCLSKIVMLLSTDQSRKHSLP